MATIRDAVSVSVADVEADWLAILHDPNASLATADKKLVASALPLTERANTFTATQTFADVLISSCQIQSGKYLTLETMISALTFVANTALTIDTRIVVPSGTGSYFWMIEGMASARRPSANPAQCLFRATAYSNNSAAVSLTSGSITAAYSATWTAASAGKTGNNLAITLTNSEAVTKGAIFLRVLRIDAD